MLSAVVLTKDDAKPSARCLDSLAFCDEIIQKNFPGNFAEKRNEAMRQAKGDWILFIDADEVVTKELAEEIRTVVLNEKKSNNAAYYIKRRDFWWGRQLRWGEVLDARTRGFIRLVKKNSGEWKGAVHETFSPNGHVGSLSGFIEHYPHPTVAEFLADINIYSRLRADELFEQGKKTNVFELLVVPAGKFVYTYFFLLGFLDGAAGFAYSFLMSFHSFLVRSKLFLKTNV